MNTKAEDPAETRSPTKVDPLLNDSPLCSNTVPRVYDSFQDRGPEICQENTPHIFQDRGPDSSQYNNPYILQSPGKPAADLIAQGFNVIPLVEAGKKSNSEALEDVRESNRWSLLRDNPLSQAETEQVFNEHRCGVGIITGVKVKGGYLCVVDIDDTASMPPVPVLPETVCAETGKGSHYYYVTDEPLSSQALKHNGKRYGELLGVGRLAVAPPSYHPGKVVHRQGEFQDSTPNGRPNGGCYGWILPPHTTEIAPLPDVLKEVLCLSKSPQVRSNCLSKNILLLNQGVKDLKDSYGQDLTTALLTSEYLVLKTAEILGIKITWAESKFVCPFHPNESEPSANFHRHPNGVYMLRDWHYGDQEKHGRVSLSQLYCDHVTGHLRKIKEVEDAPRRWVSRITANGMVQPKPEAALWLVRLSNEAGLVELPEIKTVPLPATAPLEVRKAQESCLLMQRCRLRYDLTNAVTPWPCTVGFLEAWGSMTKAEAVAGLRWLIKHGYWQQEAQGTRSGGGKPGIPSLWRNGTAVEVRDRQRLLDMKARARKAEPEVNVADVVSVGEVLKVL